jgi:cytochrome c-type biogenesis protein CcmH
MTAPAVAGRAVRAPGRDALLLFVAVAVTVGTLVVVMMSGAQSASLPAQAKEVAASLRCPVCEDLSAADSPAPMAAEMRRQILQDLRRGQSAEQIRSTFVRAYGPSVLMAPPHSGVGSIAYLLPVLVVGVAVVTGAVLLRRMVRRPSAVGSVPAPRKEEQR